MSVIHFFLLLTMNEYNSMNIAIYIYFYHISYISSLWSVFLSLALVYWVVCLLIKSCRNTHSQRLKKKSQRNTVCMLRENIKFFLPIYNLPFYFSNEPFWGALPHILPLYPTITGLSVMQPKKLPSVSWDSAKHKESSIRPNEFEAIQQELSLYQYVKSTKIFIAS